MCSRNPNMEILGKKISNTRSEKFIMKIPKFKYVLENTNLEMHSGKGVSEVFFSKPFFLLIFVIL